MRKLVRYDLCRAFHQLSTYVLFAVTLIFALISAADATFLSDEPGGGLLPTFGNAMASGKDILLMLSGCMCGLLIGEDFAIGAYSLGVSSGHSRWKILGGRTASCFLLIALMLVEYMLIAAALSMIYVKTFVFSELFCLIGLSLLHILHFCMINTLCVLMCFVLKKKVNATAVCLFLNLLLLALIGLLCTKIEFLTPAYLKSVPVLTYTMFGGDENSLTVLGSTLICGLLAAGIFFAAGKVFEKEELQ